jgi:hypothetical protein
MLIVIPVAVFIGYFLFQASIIGDYYSIIGRVSNIAYSSGGWGHSDLTTVYFEDNRTLIIHEVVANITIGKIYNFTFGNIQYRKDIFISVEEVSS